MSVDCGRKSEYTDMLVYSDFVSPRYTPCILHYDNPLPSVILYYLKKWMDSYEKQTLSGEKHQLYEYAAGIGTSCSESY